MALSISAFAQLDSAKLTRASKYVLDSLEKRGQPVVTSYQLFLIVYQAYQAGKRKRLYLRAEKPLEHHFQTLRNNLIEARAIIMDRDYGRSAYTIPSVPDLPAEEIVCIIDPLSHIAYLSAMQRWGLTDRSPDRLQIIRPDRKLYRQKVAAMTERACTEMGYSELPVPFVQTSHPETVRGRNLSVHESADPGMWQDIRGAKFRISTIGQTFLDMLRSPDRCGGMAHVIDVWREEASTYLDQIIAAVDANDKKIVHARAGYILDELMGLEHPILGKWAQDVVRGGTRLLDPAKPFQSKYSERWCISINV
jgi:predicted transcriptional regulator of viral defense system